jgi:chitodextrinase
LVHSTTYTFEVRAYDAAGNRSDWSDEAEGTTPFSADSEAPTVPNDLTATPVSLTQINLSWSPSVDNIAVTGYEIRIDGGAPIDIGLNLNSNRTGLSENTEYDFEVRAYDAAGNRSDWSPVETVSTLADTAPPNAPWWVYGIWNGTNIPVNWEPVSNATGYELMENGVIYDMGNVINTVRPGTPGLYFEYYARAYNSYGTSAWSPVFGVLKY